MMATLPGPRAAVRPSRARPRGVPASSWPRARSGAFALARPAGISPYQGAPAGTQPFQPQIQFFHSSQGFGCSGGIGMLRDTGRDRDPVEGPSNRRDGFATATPETTCLPAGPGLGVFADDGP